MIGYLAADILVSELSAEEKLNAVLRRHYIDNLILLDYVQWCINTENCDDLGLAQRFAAGKLVKTDIEAAREARKMPNCSATYACTFSSKPEVQEKQIDKLLELIGAIV